MAEKTMNEQLAEQVGAGDSKIIAAIFGTLTDESEAKVLLAAAPPATVEEISEKTGIPVRDVERMIDPLFRKGLLFKSKKKDGTRYYRVRHLLQMHDSTAVAIDPSREMLDLWKQYMVEEWADFSRKFEEKLPSSVMRVIPVNVSVGLNTQILAYDDVKNLIDGAKNLAVTKCSCRAIDGACGKDLDVCIQIDRAADYAIERGTGRQISKEETIELLKKCEEEGLVHVAENKKALGHVICNCCNDCCINWPSVRPEMGTFVAPSRYKAWVEPEECIGCDLCLERCYFNALSMEEDRELAVVDAENCMGCGLCQVVCPTDAILMQEARPEEFVPGN
jgi:formate hydrogenlyase subunit 6/NADH:ubiquinone oxidoreductase subunit I/predicted transcriptional regulator